MIHRETDHHQAGRPARIMAKMNALVDPDVIVALYQASQAGVPIDLIVRGICCLRPGLAGISETIRVISIVGRFLEHSRAYYFLNGGDEEVYIGSADWMPRNLDRRIEAVTPVDDPLHRQTLREILLLMWQDNRQAWELLPDGTYRQHQPGAGRAGARESTDAWGARGEGVSGGGHAVIPSEARDLAQPSKILVAFARDDGTGAPLVAQPRRLREPLHQILLLRRELVGHRELNADQLVPAAAVLLQALSLDPELPPRLGARRDPQHHLLAVQRADPNPGAECRLREVERHFADDVETVAAEEAIGLDLERDDDVAGRRPLRLRARPDPGAGCAGRSRSPAAR